MEHGEKTRIALTDHCKQYPKLQITDIFKFLYQSSFGCGHMVSSEESAIAFIREEYAAMSSRQSVKTETLDGAYSRAHLSWLDEGLGAHTLGKLFYRSAKEEPNGEKDLILKLDIARELVAVGALPFSHRTFDELLSKWQADSFSAVRHSEEFRAAYAPAYRVIANEYVKFLPLLARIDRGLCKGSLTVAVEGGSASGKTTFSKLLSELYDCNVFHMDDFFLRPEQRTEERFAEVGGNVDRERFFDEVLKPLSEKRKVSYRRFDCGTQTLCPPITVEPKALTIIEGAYSMHPSLAPFYDLSVFLDIGSEYQAERIRNRNSSELANRFFSEWIPMEEEYFLKTDIENRCDMIVKITK